MVRERFSVEAMLDGYEKAFEKILALRVGREWGKRSLLQEQLRSEAIGNIRETMYELDCGCGCHLEGKDEQRLIIKFFLHLEAAHRR